MKNHLVVIALSVITLLASSCSRDYHLELVKAEKREERSIDTTGATISNNALNPIGSGKLLSRIQTDVEIRDGISPVKKISFSNHPDISLRTSIPATSTLRENNSVKEIIRSGNTDSSDLMQDENKLLILWVALFATAIVFTIIGGPLWWIGIIAALVGLVFLILWLMLIVEEE